MEIVNVVMLNYYQQGEMMPRKIYETEQDRKNEKKVADYLQKIWKCKCKKLSYKDIVDYAVTRDNLILSWVEIKCRKISYNYKPFYMISMNKINNGRVLAAQKEKPFLLVVKFTDGLYVYKDKGETHILKWGGINKKYIRDEQDREPCYLIDTDLFQKIQ